MKVATLTTTYTTLTVTAVGKCLANSLNPIGLHRHRIASRRAVIACTARRSSASIADNPRSIGRSLKVRTDSTILTVCHLTFVHQKKIT